MDDKQTILVIYTKHGKTQNQNSGYCKRYAFNVSTKAEIKEGDLLETSKYDAYLQVVKVLKECYSFVNRQTGDLSYSCTSTNDFRIRTLKILEAAEEDVIVARRVKTEE